MESTKAEVIVTLTPSPESRAHTTREMIISRDTRHIDIGRGSKNPQKGNQPSSENAYFDCPIISRQHARITASAIFKSLHITDMSSTHGTFVGGRKITPEQPYKLRDGQSVTFGTRVINGPTEYKPITFFINQKWQPRKPIIDISLEESEKAGPDLVGRHDREPSIQVLEPNAHTTYTVPSDLDTESDSDESLVLETSSSIIVKDAQSSNVTTPDQAVAAIKEQSPSSPLSVSNQPTTSEGKPKGAPLSEIIAKTALHAQGSSQIDPINVDGDNSKDDAGSEEEGPEELPTTTHKKRSNILRLLNEGSPSPQKPQAHDKPNTNGEIKEASMTEESDLSDSDQDDAFPLDDDAIFDVDSDFEPSDAAQDTPDLAKTHGAPLDNAGTLAPDTRALPVSLPVIDLDEDLEMDMDRNSIYQSRTRDGVSDLYSKYYPEENSMYPPQMMHTYAEIRNRLLPAMQNEFRDTAWTRDAHPTGNALLGKEVGSNPKFTKPLNISKATGVSSSKLNISNLINPNSLDQRQTSKRTWEQMNHDDDPEVMYYPKAFNQGCSQETQQPDAQPQQHLPTPRETRATTTQTDSVTPSISASVAPPVVLLSSAVPAPAPKRAKTSRFGRFGRDLTTLASGVCLGAVGLAVALITTVPASVHEEALREI